MGKYDTMKEREEKLKRQLQADIATHQNQASAGYANIADEANSFEPAPVPIPLVDQLKSERTRKVREHSQFLREIDRQIGLLEETNAEETMKRGYELLNRCHTTFI